MRFFVDQCREQSPLSSLPGLLRRRYFLQIAIGVLAFAAGAAAQTTVPASSASLLSCPLLRQLDGETQSLYQSVKGGLVLVELPPPRWVQSFTHHPTTEASRPPTAPDVSDTPRERNSPLEQRSGNIFSRLSGINLPTDVDSELPKVLGIILDSAGHVLLPTFIEKDAAQDRPILIIDPDGCVVRSRLVGSDSQTGLSIVQMDKPVGKPLKLIGTRPADGSLVMLLSPGGESGRLIVWTGGDQDRGIIVGIDGAIQGFAEAGQFMSADMIRPLAEELVRDHMIHRAFLGVSIVQTYTPDGRRALRIDEVIPHSAAADAGLREGDFILSFAAVPISDAPSFSAIIAETNGRADLQILRDQKLVTVPVELRLQ